jgi:hypothetical protein
MNSELGQASNSHILNGWQDNDLRTGVDMYIALKISSLATQPDGSKLVLIHRDFSNICYITATTQYLADCENNPHQFDF